MLKQINYSAGPKSYFEEQINDNPDRRFVLAENLNTEDNYFLLDLSGKKSIFEDSITLRSLYSIGNDRFNGYLFYQAFDLRTEDRELLQKVAPTVLEKTKDYSNELNTGYLFERVDHPQTTVMITTWDTEKALDDWLNSPIYHELDDFISKRLRNFSEKFRVTE